MYSRHEGVVVLDQIAEMRFVWMCGVCGRRRTHSSTKSLRGNKKTRLQACARSLRNISLALQHPRAVAKSTLVNILHFEKMNAVRSRRMSTQNSGVRSAPKWEGLITALIVATSDNTTTAHAADIYNRWRTEMLNLRHEFECREATSRCKAVREYLVEVDALLPDIQQRVSEMTGGLVGPPTPAELAAAKRACEAMRLANENTAQKPIYGAHSYSKQVTSKLLRSAPPPAPMGRAPTCPQMYDRAGPPSHKPNKPSDRNRGVGGGGGGSGSMLKYAAAAAAATSGKYAALPPPYRIEGKSSSSITSPPPPPPKYDRISSSISRKRSAPPVPEVASVPPMGNNGGVGSRHHQQPRLSGGGGSHLNVGASAYSQVLVKEEKEDQVSTLGRGGGLYGQHQQLPIVSPKRQRLSGASSYSHPSARGGGGPFYKEKVMSFPIHDKYREGRVGTARAQPAPVASWRDKDVKDNRHNYGSSGGLDQKRKLSNSNRNEYDMNPNLSGMLLNHHQQHQPHQKQRSHQQQASSSHGRYGMDHHSPLNNSNNQSYTKRNNQPYMGGGLPPLNTGATVPGASAADPSGVPTGPPPPYMPSKSALHRGSPGSSVSRANPASKVKNPLER
mmetsp:Transcript_30873/g.59530  ORF Transcript_30873/g.59530 Transcript_30873/m.59530 type:complete len:616 (-) Transcript_30873:171-2018(-)